MAAKKKLVLYDERVRVLARFREQGSVLKGTAEGSCEGFEVELSIDSDEPPHEIAELVRLAHRMCFTEAALAGGVRLVVRDLLNGAPLPEDGSAA